MRQLYKEVKGTTGAVSRKTEEPVRSTTEATTSTEGSETTHGEVPTETKGRADEDSSASFEESTSEERGTTHAAVSVTKISGSSSAGITTSAGGNTGSESSISDTTSIATEVTTSAHTPQPVCSGPPPPAPACHGPLGEEKSPGDVWTSNCHQCTCTEARAVDCKPKECPSPPTCKTGEKLMTFKSNDSCCEISHCEPRTCLYNDTDYEIGASFDDPSNPCVSYTCNSTGLVAVVQDCPKQTWCTEGERTYDSKKCCYTCKSDCRTSPVNVTIRYNGCRKKVEMARCVGECKRTLKYNYETFQLENSCICCREENYEYRDIELDCSDGSTIPYRYRHTTTCSCLDQCEQSTAS
ncbi:mucin-19-like [Cricetulus griseus]|uniref:Mucin-19-like n=1 Tax=Cricetulus griseus TaxID=10029 RepID=A0A9J7K0I1_CRIGR|nr:mucin-19-like [Cricetulus griseus]XP_035294710.1 mucin-19-like [Cricetulus griseus]